MIEKAVSLSTGKSNPFAYVNAILSDWKNDGIFSPDKIPTIKQSKGNAFKSQTYTKEELDDLIDNIDDVDF